MSISIEEVEKYIFDPQKPKKCKSYKLLLNIAKKGSFSYFSPSFFQYFFKNDIFDSEFKSELWDVPSNYKFMSADEKIELFREQLSEKELEDFINKKELNLSTFQKFNFLNIFKLVKSEKSTYGYYDVDIKVMDELDVDIKDNLLIDEKIKQYEKTIFKNYNNHFILFSLNNFEVLNLGMSRSSIFVTLEKNIDLFIELNTSNVKPIFLKKIEDVELLLNVLNEDLKDERQKKIEREDISTLNKVNIKNFFSIKNLSLGNLKDKKEIYILGENGDGKSLFLQALATGLKGSERDGQELFRNIKNEYILNLEDSNKNTYNATGVEYKNLFAYGANRNNNCQMLEDESGFLTLFDNKLDLKNPLKWLQKIDYKENRGDEVLLSVTDAKNLLKSLLNSDVEIDISPDDVTFKEKGSIVSFEQLSAGYKGVITIISDLLVRLSENQPYIKDIKDFKGIVLIDEVELHLHPKWKYDFVKKIRNVFPNIQFIMTTHSPTVLLGASKEAVFYKIYKDEGEVKISNQIANEGYTNNSLVSSPLFDLETITSRDYDKRISSDDYVYDKIHERVSLKIKDNVNIDEDEILKLIDEELDNL